MSSLVEDDLVRASTFFALALVLTSITGFLIGEFRLGVEIGLLLGAGFAVFAFFFIKPTGDESGVTEAEADTDAPDTDAVAANEE